MDHTKNKAAIDAELDSEKILVGCYKHFYFGPSKKGATVAKPTSGCTDCWKVYWIHDLASVVPEKRAERIAEIHEILTSLNKLVETGKFDYTPQRHASFEYEKDGLVN